MAGSIKSVSVVFQAFTDKFEKKVDKAGNKMGGFAKKAVGFAAGFLVAKKVINEVSLAMQELGALDKTVEALDVSPDFLRGIDLAAASVGESFEKAQDLIKEFNIRMGEAKTGAGPAVNGLALIGKTLEDFEGMSTEDTFLAIADAISNIGDQQEKIFVAGEFFGGAGEDMLALLDQGEAGLTSFIEKARELGGPISKKDLEGISEANQAINEMGKAFDSIFQKIAIEFAPLVTMIVEGFTEVLKVVRKIGDAWDYVQDSLEDNLAYLIGGQEAVDIELGGKSKKGGTQLKKGGTQLPKALKDPVVTKGFAQAAAAQSSKAFDILNPAKPNSIAGKNAAANEQTQKNTAKISQVLASKSSSFKFVQVGFL
jgi:hypothetical protein